MIIFPLDLIDSICVNIFLQRCCKDIYRKNKNKNNTNNVYYMIWWWDYNTLLAMYYYWDTEKHHFHQYTWLPHISMNIFMFIYNNKNNFQTTHISQRQNIKFSSFLCGFWRKDIRKDIHQIMCNFTNQYLNVKLLQRNVVVYMYYVIKESKE